MKKMNLILTALFSLVSLPVFADTTVVQTVPSQTVVVQQEPLVIATSQDPRQIEGEIIKVSYPENEITIRDIDGRERRVLLKQGMINDYKVDDYVKIYLMADMKEAKTIATQKTADVEGDIVLVDQARNQIVVHQPSGRETIVFLRPGMVDSYRVGDVVRLYVVSDHPHLEEAKIIRVR